MKTVIYNIGTLAGILPEGKLKLDGAEMNHVECIENAYLVIEDGIIVEFDVSSECGFKNRATPLAAGGGAQACLGGVVLTASTSTILAA